ncbi:MAG: hypothetical protein KAW47_10970, partial [Thermoplasmatales archaeon]|nr:hypothetical protein [Thermoplasmatales archaeon]
MSNETDAIFSGLNAVGKKWKKAKRQSDKEDRLSRKQIKYTYWKPEKHYMKDVCNANMEKVY